MRVYLDNCCFNRPYDDQSSARISLESQAKLEIQALIKDGEIELATSYMLQFENDQNPYEMRRNATAAFAKSFSAIHIGADRSDEVGRIAETITQTGVKAKDAIHVASAIAANCDYFISTDDRLLKYVTGDIALVNPMEFIRLEMGNDDD